MRFKRSFSKVRRRRPLLIVICLLVILLVGASAAGGWYRHNLNPASSSTTTTYFTIQKGASLHQIGVGLKRAKLIRNSTAFEYYVRTNELYNDLKAGTYSLSQSMSVKEIVDKIVKGDVAKNLLTILPGRTINQVKAAFKESGYSDAEIREAFNPKTYGGRPALSSLPSGATLEGYLYPDSFQKTGDTPATTIISESLDELQSKLTSDIIKGFTAQGLSTYQGIILASIVYQETDDPKYESTVAQVFLSRLKAGMLLGSDVTAYYGAGVAGVDSSVSFDSAYNTRLHPGLPPGPIGNFTADALEAVAHPNNTDFLYFVAGDDGVMHFTHTQAEHDAAAAKYCQKKCAQ